MRQPAADPSIAAAKTDRFQAMKRCAGVIRAIESMRSQKVACDSNREWPDEWAACKKRISSFDERLQRAEAMLSECSPTDIGDSEFRYWRSIVEAAETGDMDAALCYVESDIWLRRPWSEEDVARYRTLAPAYVDRAFAAGDWRIAEIFFSGLRRAPSNELLINDSVDGRIIQYRMNRLLRLGAVGNFAISLDIVSVDTNDPLPAADRLPAENWAKDMYARYFSHSPKMESPPIPCAVIEDDISPNPFL